MSSLVNQQSSSSAMSEEEAAVGHALCLGNSAIFPYILDVAIQFGVFDVLGKAGSDAKMSSKQIASEIRAKNPDAPCLLDRMLRILACYDLVTCVSRNIDADAGDGEHGEKLYGLSLSGEAFVSDETKGSLAAFTVCKNKVEVCLITVEQLELTQLINYLILQHFPFFILQI
ncbi:hypothetical protein V6N12_055114 [Hibiscus sabdariffa]|uniref:O-methyltransferase dimerisation domain-containing protein n=1 Tax=Hibiscus sabdariffa TaxID=183260 RepID=A0ABR2A1P1_9ROSI